MGDVVINTVVSTGAELKIKKCLAEVSFFQLCAFFLSLSGWLMCMTSAILVQWRVWHVSNHYGGTSIAWIGIWETCRVDEDPSIVDEQNLMNCTELSNLHTFLPSEIIAAQNLMVLATIAGAVQTGFLSVAFLNIYKKQKQRKHVSNLFLIAGLLNLSSGIGVFIPIVWNMVSVLSEAPIFFPEDFHLPHQPEYQYVGAALPIGLISAIFQILSGCFILCNNHLAVKKMSALATEASARASETTLCQKCSLSLVPKTPKPEESASVTIESPLDVQHIENPSVILQMDNFSEDMTNPREPVPSLPESHIVLVTPYTEPTVGDESK
ncbi:claudin-34-like [Hemicordylus capensis]|uniref:claudin-34-like n=1 Tax=Hemicordylus capensis TaxID=884348 RepID=UPI0023028FA6|nr:claudin-34-like [Hemicordylus capensis]XP_053161194.1 claudin-34-like [Hemicordylus capensis]